MWSTGSTAGRTRQIDAWRRSTSSSTGRTRPTYTWYGEERVVTEDAHTSALRYFAAWKEDLRRHAEEKTPEPEETSIPIDEVTFPNGWPEDAGILVLRNEFPAPAPVTVGTRTHPSVADAYEAVAGTVAPQARTAVMAALLRLKFAQHAGLAETLTATGTSRLIYTDHSTFWGQGRNWMGRLLELVRAELAVHNQEPFTTVNVVPE